MLQFSMKTCVIVNPKAGSVEDVDHLRRAVQRLGQCEVRQTTASGEATTLARRAVHEGYGQVVAAGGDGTVSEVLNGLGPDFGVRFGVIPLGTGNDFARSLDMPQDLEAAIEAVRAGQTRRIDVGRITHGETTWFANTSGAGFATLLADNVASGSKGWWGRWAYFWAGLKTVPQMPEYEVTLTVDEAERQELKVANIMVCNGRYVGGGIRIAPQALLDDGLLEVVIVPVLSLPRLPALLTRLIQGDPQQVDELIVLRGRRIHIESKPALPFNVDGEPAGESPMQYEALPQAVEAVVGPAPCVR
jgi:diacylglycerol kinase (ATP)